MNRLMGAGVTKKQRALGRISPLVVLLLVTSACGSDAAGPETGFLRTSQGIEYRAWTEVLESFPIQLRTNVRMTNVTSSAIDIMFPDGCVVLVRAYRENATVPTWDQRSNTGCTAALVPVHLEPGRSATYVSATGARVILGDSLPDGFYRLEAYLRPDSGPVTVDAGTVPLSVPRP